MLHKVRLGHFTVDEIGRKRPTFTEVIVEADSGDSAAKTAIDTYGNDLANPRGSDYAMKVGVMGIECPTPEEVAAWQAKHSLGAATFHSPIGPAQEVHARAQEPAADDETAELRRAYDGEAPTGATIIPATPAVEEPKPDRMAKARAAKAAKKAQRAA